jgi:hypothetical protein
MADETTTTTDTTATDTTSTVTPAEPAAAVTPPAPDGADTTPSAAAVTDPEGPVSVQVSTGSVEAQVQGPAAAPQSVVPVHETHVKADRVITDTSDPLAVQVPPHGQGDALTPIGAAYADARAPEDVFAAAE